MCQILALLLLLPLTGFAQEKKEKTADPKPGEEREFEIFKEVKMRFCWIPAGKATLGSPTEEKERRKDEKEHDFETKGFWLGKYEVTQGEYEGVTGDNPSKYKRARLPVNSVSWEDCQTFIEKCGGKGMKLKLPHEDEWEYACRGGKGNKQAFYWGDVLNGDKANQDGTLPYGTTTKGEYLKKTTEVGSYEKAAPHPWGLCDMSGNVFEWCENLHGIGSSFRVSRGGSWVYDAEFCRSAFRLRDDPTIRLNDLGFRLALVP
ncbi:formylglycine-generating enzyme family protein [Zavarzinella formosa]|uniref:formylglycine-generating enzyme family protein n=1 Tax=Zavarzinella formosa TaxID=360055 RepID=UPI0003162DC6|nr:formylglycine-generating enzyme family protein [Zavarzinella formosa]